MGECDTYLEFCMSKDSIGAAEFGFGQPCTAQGQFESRQGEKMSPWLHPGDNLAHPGDNLATTWRHPGDNLATPWRQPGDNFATMKARHSSAYLTHGSVNGI